MVKFQQLAPHPLLQAPRGEPLKLFRAVAVASGDGAPGSVLAIDAANGKTLWSFQAAGSVNTGAAVVNGVVYWGSGYAHLGIPGWTGSTTFYAFSLKGN